MLCLPVLHCSKDTEPVRTNKARLELLEKPEALLDPGFTPGTAQVHGVGLGDLKEEIPCNLKKVNDADWYQCGSEGQARFRIDDGRVRSLRLEGKVLEALAIHSPEDIEKRFGPPDRVEAKQAPLSDLVYRRTFIYEDRGLECSWLPSSGAFYILISEPEKP
jgi:hypothetical protein